MEKEFVPYDLALRLHEFGFDEPCFGYYVEGELRGVNLGIEQLGGIKPYYQRFGFHTLSNHDIDNPNKIVVTAPLYQQAFRWFDYSTEWSGFIVPSKEEGCFEWWIQNYTDPQLSIESEDWYRGREEAELACLEKLIEIVETKSE